MTNEIIEIKSINTSAKLLLIPLYGNKVRAGFASPADDFIEEYLDLNKLLIKHQEATFFVSVVGRSMVNVVIYLNDILTVDRPLEASNRDIIIAVRWRNDRKIPHTNYPNGILSKAESQHHKDIPVDGELHV